MMDADERTETIADLFYIMEYARNIRTRMIDGQEPSHAHAGMAAQMANLSVRVRDRMRGKANWTGDAE